MEKIFSFICCGSVDDGKSTLIGRILLDTGCVKKDQLEDALKASKKNGSDKIELALLLDGLLAEREQQITIDIAHRYFDYKNVRFHILDCPGHEQYTKNMAIAAAMSGTAVVVVDCTRGIQSQTRRHIEICNLFGVKNLCICLTKCDLIMDEDSVPDDGVIQKLTQEIELFLQQYNFEYEIFPVSAVTGYNTDKILAQIYKYSQTNVTSNNKGTILHIQSARLFKGKRYYYGRNVFDDGIQNGSNYTVYPQNKNLTITDVPAIGCVQIKEDIDIEQGDCITNLPVLVSNHIHHKTIWFDQPSEQMLLKHGSRVVKIIQYDEDEIETDTSLIFNNIEDIKQNAFGILIDAVSKKTIGCAVFYANKENTDNDCAKRVYDCRNLKADEKTEKIAELKAKFPMNVLVINEAEILKILGSVDAHAVEKIACLFSEQNIRIILV